LNHRMLWAGRDLTDYLVPTTLSWAGDHADYLKCYRPQLGTTMAFRRPTAPWLMSRC